MPGGLTCTGHSTPRWPQRSYRSGPIMRGPMPFCSGRAGVWFRKKESLMIDPRLELVVAEQPYPLLFATISGAHLYGFPSPDSDYDLRGVHILPLREVVGLDTGPETIEVSRKDELDLDLVTHDVKKFFGLLLKKNGYVLEQLYSPLIVKTSAGHEELKELARGCVTR